MRFAWKALGLGLLAMSAAACEDGINFCTDNNRDDAGQCREIPDFPNDGGLDATTPPSDATTPTDALVPDASIPVDASGLDATVDAGADASAPPTTLNIEDFCAAVYERGRAWRDKLDECCLNAAAEDRSIFLESGLSYFDGSSSVAESVDGCVNALNAQVGANLEFTGSLALPCASKYAAQFDAPQVACPAEGYDIDVIESKIGKQAQDLVQLAECRSALVGKLALNAVCVGDFQCRAGLRCLGGSTGKNCRDPLGNGAACLRSAECADGLECVGPVGGAGRVCRPSSQPVAVTAACTNSTECDQETFCDNGVCRAPTNRRICAQ
jgi:hypothetical protein